MLRMLKIPFYSSFKKIGYPKMMPMSIVFMITYKCNSRCKTCNIWKIKDSSKELELWEYERVFHSVGKPFWATIEGGEPFLRKDFSDIVKLFYETCNPKIINIPTNGSLYKIIPKTIKKILKFSNEAKIILNISLDGVNNEHDKIRGFPGNFDLTMKTIHELKKIKSNNFTLGINSIISKFNSQNFHELYNFVENKIRPDSYIVETAQSRREYFNLDSKLLDKESIKNLRFFVNKMGEKELSGIPKIIKSFRLLYYSNLLGGYKIPCYSGWISCQINPYGDVWVCATKGCKFGNLRKSNYDFKKIWFSEKANKIRQQLNQRDCFCSLANASYTNMLCNFTALTKVSKNLLW